MRAKTNKVGAWVPGGHGGPPETLFRDQEQVGEGMRHMRDTLIHRGNFRFLDSPEKEIYAFATPLFLALGRQEELYQWNRRIVQALERLAEWLRSSPARAKEHLLFHASMDQAFFEFDPGFGEMLPIHRLDFVTPEHGFPQLLEANAGCPGGELDPALVAEAFLNSPLGRNLDESTRKSIYFHDPRDESLMNLLRIYRAFRRDHPAFPESPTIGLVTSSAQAHFMIPECRGIAAHYQRRGFHTILGDLLELRRDAGQVFLHNEPLHLIFRKFSTLSFRIRMQDQARFGEENCRRVRRVWQAVVEGEACMVNPLGSTFMQDKGLLQLLRSRNPGLQAVIPETVILQPELPTRDPFLWDAIRHGEPFILKRRVSFAALHVILDPKEIRSRAPDFIRKVPGQWVAQRRLAPPKYPFAIWDGRQTRIGRFPFTISPFGRSCFVRTAWTGDDVPLGAHAGAAATCALLIEEGQGGQGAGDRRQ